jgi:hypothetical protein
MSSNSPFATWAANTVEGTVALYHWTGMNCEVDRISPGWLTLHELCTSQFSFRSARLVVSARPAAEQASNNRAAITGHRFTLHELTILASIFFSFPSKTVDRGPFSGQCGICD